MFIFENSLIPFPGFSAVNICGILFVRKGKKAKLTQRTIRHESIHTKQWLELLYIGFLLWYLLEWVIRLLGRGDAYRSISFEREAYDNEKDTKYLSKRKPYAWLKYVTKKNIIK